ncbi:MAG: YhjD/YihY/BrkB family envelope integrity protein [Gammaproteobacteria bacterium]
MERWNQRIHAWLWQRDLPSGTPQRALLTVSRFAYALARELSSGELSLRAMSLVYTTMLAIVPLLALSFSILKGLGFHRQMEPLLLSVLAPLGPRSEELTAAVIGFVDNVQGSALAGVSLLLLILTALSMAHKVENSFNFVWRVDRPRSFGRRFGEYLSVMLVGPALMSVAMGTLATILNTAVVNRLREIEPFGSLIVEVTQLTPYVLVIGVFSFLYSFVPNTKVRIRTALIGGVVAGIVWVGCGELFAQFVASTSRTAVIYSGFAIMIFGMLWLYVSWLVLLLGAQFTFFYQNPDYLSLERRTPNMSNEVTERLAISVMLLVGQDTAESTDGWGMSGLAARIGVPRHLLESVVGALRDTGLLVETTEERLVPARDLRKISVAEILASVRASDADGRTTAPGQWNPTVQAVARQVDAAIYEAVESRSLADLVDENATQAQPETS